MKKLEESDGPYYEQSKEWWKEKNKITMAPDKIYVKEFDEGISQMWSSIKAASWTTAIAQHEYIRKDALLEIIEAARESAITQKNFNNCPVEQEARIDAYDYIKHKIESL